jgi:hypothetical protein
MAFRKSSSSAKGLMSPTGTGDGKGAIAGADGAPSSPGSSFRKSSKSGSISSPVEFGSKGMPSGIKVKHNRPAILD